MALPAQRRWYPLVFVIAALVLLPLSVLLLSWQSIDAQICDPYPERTEAYEQNHAEGQ